MAFLENVDKAKLQKILIITVCTLMLAALALLLVIVIMSIEPTGLQGTDMEFKDYTLTDKDLGSGSLILADKEHPYKAENEEWLELTGCTAFMEAQSDATGIGVPESEYYKKNYIPWKAMRLNTSAMASLHRMLTDAKGAVAQNPITIDAAYDVVKFGSSYAYDTALMVLLSDYESTGAVRKELSEEYRNWLADSSAKYGFITTDVEDAYRFVGIPHAMYISDEKLSLADYLTYLKANTANDNGLSFTADGEQYYIYYVTAKVGDTVKVPADKDYTISGTNEGGIVITVKLGK